MKINARYIEIEQLASAPANPAASTYRMYALSSDERFYTRNSAGVEDFAAGGSFAFIQDVNVTTPSDGDVLLFNTGELENAPLELDDLGDVLASSPSDQDVLRWDNQNGRYEAVPLELRFDRTNFTNFDRNRFYGEVPGSYIGYDTSFFNHNYQYQWPQIILGNDFQNQPSAIGAGYDNTTTPIILNGSTQVTLSNYEVWNEFDGLGAGDPINFNRLNSTMELNQGGSAAHRVDLRFRFDGSGLGGTSTVSVTLEEHFSGDIFGLWDGTVSPGDTVEDTLVLPVTLFLGDALALNVSGTGGIEFYFAMRFRPYRFYPEDTAGSYRIPNYSNFAD